MACPSSRFPNVYALASKQSRLDRGNGLTQQGLTAALDTLQKSPVDVGDLTLDVGDKNRISRVFNDVVGQSQLGLGLAALSDFTQQASVRVDRLSYI